MAVIAPFRALRFDAAAGDLGRVTAPPYDVISPEEREALERSNPHNAVRLTLPRDGADGPAGKYTRARDLLDLWQREGALRRDETPSVTVYEQRYLLRGQPRTQRGILAAARMTDPQVGGILPHEGTMAGPVEDRLALMRATRVNLEPIFGVYDGEAGPARDAIEAAAAGVPLARFEDGHGVENLVWRLDDPEALEAIAKGLEEATVLIADGHHRYRTAMEYRNERRAADGEGPWDATLMYLVDASRAGPALLPIHRLVCGTTAAEAISRLSSAFAVEEIRRDAPEDLAAALESGRAEDRTYVMLDRDRAWRLRLVDEGAARAAMPPGRHPAWCDLDVAVLHALVFERLLGGARAQFVHSAAEADAALAAGTADLAFLLSPVPFSAVRAIAEAREPMPSKSTYFHPKPRSGVVIRLLDDR